MEWSDLRIFLAIARERTLGGAARSPGRYTYGGYHRDLRQLTRMRALLDLVIARLAD